MSRSHPLISLEYGRRSLMLALILLLSWPFLETQGATGPYPIRSNTVSVDISDRARILKDPSDTIELQHLLGNGNMPFDSIGRKNPNIGFTDEAYWVAFEIRNESPGRTEFLLEAARGITNRVDLYRIEDGRPVDTMRSGDAIPFEQKAYEHRRSVFPLKIPRGETHRYYLNLKSDGEIIFLPLIVRDPTSFYIKDRDQQMLNGLYYGVMLIVFLIFAFFYQVLRERSFLFYVLYVLSIGLLQFGLDGYAHQLIATESTWFADRSVLTTACLTVFFVYLYTRHYLQTRERSQHLDKVFRFLIGIAGLSVLATLTQGALYVLAYPFINAFSLLTSLLILASIFLLRQKGYSVPITFTMAFVFLMSGAILFLLGNTGLLPNNFFLRNGLKFGTSAEILFLSLTMALKYRELQGEKEKAQAEALHQLEEKKALVDQHNVQLEEKVEERTRDLNREKEKLAETNQEIMSSIRYAQRIQNTILPSEESIRDQLPDSFVLLKPRDHVSGDFYWITQAPQDLSRVYVAAVDCTGHGVPGALLSLMGKDILNRSLKEVSSGSAADILDHLDRNIVDIFSSRSGKDEVKDGMDLALCRVNLEKRTLSFAGANNPLYIIRAGELHELKGDKASIGRSMGGEPGGFTARSFSLQKGDALYIFSDGYADQFGGERGKKFKYKRFKETLLSIQSYSMQEQKTYLNETIENWRGGLDQVDDILVIGIRIP